MARLNRLFSCSLIVGALSFTHPVSGRKMSPVDNVTVTVVSKGI